MTSMSFDGSQSHSQNFPRYSGGGDGGFSDEVQEVKRDLEGWREVLLPISSLLRWDVSYFPGVIVASTTFAFFVVWYTGMSALTAVSLACMVVGLADFLVPYFGPSITGYTTWTGEEEYQFTAICEKVCGVQQDVSDCWKGLVIMRQQNPKLFFMVTMGILSATAWIGNLVDNLFLSYIIVTFLLLLPGVRQHDIASKYLQPVNRMLHMLKPRTDKIKTS